MLKGLEISEVALSDVLAADQSCRIDAEFFKKEDVARLKTINCLNWDILRNVTYKIDVGFVGAMQTEYTKDVTAPILLQTRNIGEFLVDDNDVLHINNAFHNLLKKSQIHYGDILIARSGSFGNAAIWLKTGLVNSSDIIIVGADRQKINPFYLVAILNSKYGRFQLERFASGAVQGHVNLTILENLKIPLLSDSLQRHVEKIVDCAHGQMTKARHEYLDAEEILLSELGFDGWTPTEESVSVKNCSDFMSAGRFDAEYFQPKYDEIVAKIKTYSGGTIKAASVLITGLVNESEDTPERYVELADIGVSGEIEGCTNAMFGELPSRARQRMATGQVIASSIEGSLDRCALVTPEYDKALCSTGFHRFCSQDINPETMLLLFKSWPIQQLMKRGCSGTILCGILPTALEHVDLPVVNPQVQKVLAAKVRESFALRAESKRLLDLAKHAVEVAIEQGEDSAVEEIKKGNK